MRKFLVPVTALWVGWAVACKEVPTGRPAGAASASSVTAYLQSYHAEVNDGAYRQRVAALVATDFSDLYRDSLGRLPDTATIRGEKLSGLRSSLEQSEHVQDVLERFDHDFASSAEYLAGLGVAPVEPSDEEISALIEFNENFFLRGGTEGAGLTAADGLDGEAVARMLVTSHYLSSLSPTTTAHISADDDVPALALQSIVSNVIGPIPGLITQQSANNANNSQAALADTNAQNAVEAQDATHPPRSNCAEPIKNSSQQRGNNWWICRCQAVPPNNAVACSWVPFSF